MRNRIAVAALLAGLAGCSPPGPDKTADTRPDGYPVCLKTYLIDHTEPAGNTVLLFYMRGGDVWKNTLLQRCIGLNQKEGFAYEASVDEICSNEQTIRMLRTGSLCMLGPFTPISKDDAKKLLESDRNG
ncbi:MAG TPA: hypothetical protein VM689_07635 [Aliidongia sp.]|nr:hypothetical protein [Aliidongia sp.]